MKNNFSYKDVYVEEGKRVLEINILPEKYCNFDCVFCPIGRSKNKIDVPTEFEDYDVALAELENMIDTTNPDLVFINSKGEALVNNKVESILDFIKSKGLKVRLLSNGYILSKKEYINIANKCDEVIGEIKTITEKDFKKIQRPIEDYTLEEYIDNTESVEKLKDVIKRINPDKIEIVRIDDERMRKTMWVDDERFEEIKKELLNVK